MSVTIPDEAAHTVLAALRNWQETRHQAHSELIDIETNFGAVQPMSDGAIDQLAEDINTSTIGE